MNLSELINEILSEWAYRVDDGQPNPKNKKHLAQLSIVLSEMGLSNIKDELFENITEADKKFTNPILNKEIPYKGADGTSKTGIVGNLLRLPKDSPGRVAAEKLMPPEGSPERDSAMKDLGSEKDGKSTGGDKEKGKEDEKGKEGGGEAGGGEEEKAKAAKAMFDPKADPAMGARLDREKAANDKLAQNDKEDSDAEQSAEVPKEDGKFSEPTNPPPQNEKGVEKDGKVAGTTIETEPGLDDIDSNLLKQRVTEMDKYWADHKADVKKAEGIAREKMGYSEEQAKALKKGTPEKSAYDKEVKKNQQPTYNLCKVSIPNSNLFCNGNKNIPRSEMPQFKGEPVEGSQAWDVLQKAKEKDPTATEVEGEPYFRQMLADKGIKVTDAEVPSENLKATQNELVGDKVLGMESGIAEAMADTMPDGSPKTEEQKVKDEKTKKNLLAPIFVSNDGYVVDGHHRWAAITRYNMEHPDKPIPLKVMIIDQPIDDAIKTSNEFASEFGVAAKSGKQAGPGAGPNAEPPANEPSRPNTNPTEDKSSIQSMKGESKTIKGKKSGKDIQTIEMEGGGMVYGTQHENTAMVDDIIDDIKSKIPQEKWKDIVFVGEGGATNNNGELEFNDEMDYAAPKFKELGAGIDSWDGDDLDVHKEESKLYKKQKEKTGLNDNQIKAGNWASMIGQGEGTDTMQPTKFLDDDGKQFLQDAAKEAGLPPIENWDNPTGEKPSEENGWKGTGDRGTLYRLSFPEDNGDKETKINDIQVAFNETRDENILEKTKELQAKGKIPITIAGEGHIDLVNGMIKNENSQYMNEISVRFAKLIKEVVDEIVAEATASQGGDWKLAARKGGPDGKIVYFGSKEKKQAAISSGSHIDVDKKLNAKQGDTTNTKADEPIAGASMYDTDYKDSRVDTPTKPEQPTGKKKKGKKNKELDQTKNTKGEFNEGNLSKDGVTDKQFADNKKVKPTPSQIKVSQIEKFFLDKNGNTKFPKKYLKVLARMLSTKTGGVTISDFTDASGAGTLSSTMGELLTLMAVTIKDDNEAKEFFGMLRENIKANGKDSIIDIGWVNSAEKVRKTQFERYDRKFGKGNWELDNMAWDVEGEVEALGMENYKQNKGFSTDVYAKVKVGGKYILDEISLKKEIKANLLNATSGRVADIMVRGLASDEDLVIYDDLNAKIDSLMGLKDAASIKEKKELIAKRDEIVEKYNVNVPDDVKVSKVQKVQRELHEKFVKNGVGEISGFLKKFCNKKDKKYRSGVLDTMKNALSQKDDYKPKVTQQLDTLCSLMPKGGFKTPQDYNNALKEAKIGDTSDNQKLNMGLMSAIAAENPQSQAAKSSKMIIKNSHNHSKAVREFLLKDPAARKGLLSSIREALPLKALFEGEENMILADVSIDNDILKDVFGVESFEELEQKLTVRDTPPPPSIVYRVAGPDGSNTDIPVAEIVSRPDGIGYGGSWKLIMAVHPDFAKKLKESNDRLNSKIK